MKWPVSSIAGIAVIVLYCIFTFSSWGLFPTSYSPANNWLSDLGNSTKNPHGAILYNLGCILTGIALFPFFIGIYKWYTTERWRKASLMITQAIGLGSAFSLIMIGVFSEDSGNLHVLWSNIYFALNLIVLILVGAVLFTHPRVIKAICGYAFIVAIINLGFVLFSSTPILEWFTVFTALGYAGLLSYNTAKIQPESQNDEK
jgi:hypothetical membrane protein